MIKELFDKKQIGVYYFHEKYLLSPAQVARSLKKFIENEIVELDGDLISLTEKGEKWIVYKRKDIFLNEKNKFWKEVPIQMKQESIEIGAFYKPDRNKLDKELFKNIEGGK